MAADAVVDLAVVVEVAVALAIVAAEVVAVDVEAPLVRPSKLTKARCSRMPERKSLSELRCAASAESGPFG